jgi:hypothetical protein
LREVFMDRSACDPSTVGVTLGLGGVTRPDCPYVWDPMAVGALVSVLTIVVGLWAYTLLERRGRFAE